jgi:hypothetical protein
LLHPLHEKLHILVALVGHGSCHPTHSFVDLWCSYQHPSFQQNTFKQPAAWWGHASSSSIGWEHHTEIAMQNRTISMRYKPHSSSDGKTCHKDGTQTWDKLLDRKRFHFSKNNNKQQANFQDGFQVSTQKPLAKMANNNPQTLNHNTKHHTWYVTTKHECYNDMLLECNDTTMKQTFEFLLLWAKMQIHLWLHQFVNTISNNNEEFKPLQKLHEINITTTLLPMVKLKMHKVVIFKKLCALEP